MNKIQKRVKENGEVNEFMNVEPKSPSDIERGVDRVIELTKKEILKMIDKCESHQWATHKVVIVEELKKQIEK